MLSKNPEETKLLAEDLAKEIMVKKAPKQAHTPNTLVCGHATVLGLYGDLGAGKTTFTQAFAKALGVSETVTSPTFVIMKKYPLEYSIFNIQYLIHIDAYRLKNADELRVLGFDKILADKNNIILIEWAERVSDILPKNHIKIIFTHVSENQRDIKINF